MNVCALAGCAGNIAASGLVLPSAGTESREERQHEVSRNKIQLFVALTGLLALVAPSSVHGQEIGQSQAETVSVAGQWMLNRALSDDPTDQLMNVRGGAQPPGGAEAGGRPPPSAGASMFEVIRRAVERFGIDQTDSTVSIAYPDHEVHLFTDGRKQKIAAADDREVEVRSRWEGQGLVIQRRVDGGLILTEQYSVHSNTGRLHVLTRLEGDRLPMPISFMRVYDPLPVGPSD
jgi:hypothetical protein